MTDLPGWLQEIRDRAGKATPGPWYRNGSYIPGRKSMVVRSPWTDKQRGDLHVAQCAEAKLSKGLIAKTSFGSFGRGQDGEWDNRDADAEFIAHSRADIPRLIELVGEMAWNLRNVTDQVQDACRSRMTPLSQCPEPSDDYCPTCPTGLRGECGAPRSLEALREYRGEVSSND